MSTKTVKFDHKTIKTFEDACHKLGIDPSNLPDVSMLPEDEGKAIVAHYKLIIIYKAINDGWAPDWSDYYQFKYYPWFEVLSSGFGFSYSNSDCALASTAVGSRLCTYSSEVALYIAEQFKEEYRDYLLFSE